MNIFVLDEDPILSAQYQNDYHCVKMILEGVQILSTAAILLGGVAPYRKTHPNHPSVRWASTSYDNFNWLKTYVKCMNDEWRYRFNHDRNHKSFEAMSQIVIEKRCFPSDGLTSFALAMPEHCKCSDAVESYRKYYITEKQHLAKWTKRKVPHWFLKTIV